MDRPAAEPAGTVRFGLLGPLLVTDVVGTVVVLPAAKQRIILAALLLRANETVSADRMMEILWGASPPPSAEAAVRNYVMRLRRQAGRAPGSLPAQRAMRSRYGIRRNTTWLRLIACGAMPGLPC